jgi:hypothetical protein
MLHWWKKVNYEMRNVSGKLYQNIRRYIPAWNFNDKLTICSSPLGGTPNEQMKKLEATQQNALNLVPRKNDELCNNTEGA